MDFEKIKNYNQKVLAVLGTLLVIIALVSIAIMVKEAIPYGWRYSGRPGGLMSDERAGRLAGDSLRRQIISYDSPMLIDTANLVYIIPASVRTLERAEYAGSLAMVDQAYEKGDKFYASGSYGKTFYGSFNNLVVYDYKNDRAEKICEERFVGTNMYAKYFDDGILIVFKGADRDTDDDGSVTLSDFNSLFVYSLETEELNKLGMDNATVLSYDFVGEGKDILILFGRDRNGDNIYNGDTEPRFVMKYDYGGNSLSPVIDGKLDSELQRLVDKI